MSIEPTDDSTANQVILALHQMDQGQELELARVLSLFSLDLH